MLRYASRPCCLTERQPVTAVVKKFEKRHGQRSSTIAYVSKSVSPGVVSSQTKSESVCSPKIILSMKMDSSKNNMSSRDSLSPVRKLKDQWEHQRDSSMSESTESCIAVCRPRVHRAECINEKSRVFEGSIVNKKTTSSADAKTSRDLSELKKWSTKLSDRIKRFQQSTSDNCVRQRGAMKMDKQEVEPNVKTQSQPLTESAAGTLSQDLGSLTSDAAKIDWPFTSVSNQVILAFQSASQLGCLLLEYVTNNHTIMILALC